VPEVNIVLAKYGMNMAEAEVDQWLVGEGDLVTEGSEVCEITTDKATIGVQAPASGTLKRVLVPNGATAEPGDILGIIESP